ncbi:CMT1A duplicated region transcript 4 protein homolog [Cuculus canorus]|uniref:CMT1A duplicated region transcript 4 protein homolog n=1 Tax=Cuculus canorus TaxID=55661 RepID=UPI0023AAB94A|nr:CMT1A duplicated region transcript 4 protein homolog [Cuculus canorus]
MDGFLKEILDPSEQDMFDHLTRMKTSSINTFRNPCAEHALTSATLGLPSHLIEYHHPKPAYTTYVAPVVKKFIEQDEQRKAAFNHPAKAEPNGESQEADSEEETQVLSMLSESSSTSVTEEESDGIPTAESSLPPPNVCYRVIFARKPPSCVLPSSSLVQSSKKE